MVVATFLALLGTVGAGALVLAAGGDPTFSDLKSLGVIALALIVGAGGTFKATTLPERKRRDADVAAERARTEQERADKLAAEARERQLRDAAEARMGPVLDAVRVLGELATAMKNRTG